MNALRFAYLSFLSLWLHGMLVVEMPTTPPAPEFPPTAGTHRMLFGLAHDGATIQAYHLTAVDLRLYGIQAPALKELGGEESRDNLRLLVPVGCILDVELTGRNCGRIKLPDGTDASTAQTVGGFAVRPQGKP